MKKIFFLAAMLCGAMTASAEDVVQVVPFKTVANVANADWDKTFSLNLKNESQTVNIIYFEMYLPNGLDLNTMYDSEEYGTFAGEMDENNPRLQMKVGPRVTKTGHAVAYNNVSDKPEYQRDGYTCYTVLISQGTNTTPIQGTDGEIATFQYVTSDIAPGVYPIYLENIELTDQASKIKLPIASTTSYVVIGEPTEANVKLEGMVPSWVNTALAEQSGIAKLDLSAVTAVNGEFTYVDGRAVVGTSATADVKYVGNKANYYSVNVPFTGAATGEFYELKSVDENYAVFTTASTVKAGETYLAKGEVALTANAAVATIENKENQTGSYVYEGKFYDGKNLTVPATRGLFDVPAGSNLRVVIDGELTGITTAEIDAQAGNTYDLQGRQSVNAKNGVFVVNGKKQFVK